MRLDTSAPEQAHEPSHTTVIRGPHPIAFNPRTDLEAIGQLIRALHFTARHQDLGGKELRMLVSLLALVNGKHFRATGEMICWPGEVALADCMGFKRSSNVHRVIQALVELELLERTTIDIEGKPRKAFRVLMPEPRSDGVQIGGGTTRERRHMSARPKWARADKTGARPKQARAAEPGARPKWAPARASNGRAPNSNGTTTLTHAPAPAPKIETKKSLRTTSSSSSPSSTTEPVVDGRRAAAAAELEGLDVTGKKADELLALVTTTRAIVRAAEKARKNRKGETGLLVWFIAHPSEIPPKFIRQAERELAPRPAPPPPRPSAAPPVKSIEDWDQLRSIAGLGPKRQKFVR